MIEGRTGQLSKLTNPRGKVTTHTFDAALRKTKTTDAMGNEVSWTLDDNGNPTAWSIKEKDGAATVTHDYEATYDEINRRETYVEIDRTNGSNTLTTQYFYDSRSNRVFLINAEGNPTRWTFDGLSRLTKREKALTLGATINDFTKAQITQWGFDDNDRLISHKDDGPNESTWAFDALDRATTMTYPDTKTVTYVYDKNDNMTKTTDPAGNVIDDTFDALNRNTSRSITLATGFLGTTAETRTFDAVNRMLTNQDNDYKLEFDYVVIGFQSFVYDETQSYVGMTAYPKTVRKTYDVNGNKATEVYPTGSNLSLGYTYNDIDRLTAISDGTNTIASYTHIGVRKKVTTFQNGSTRTNSYTGFRNELQTVHHQTSAVTTILQLDYAYNKVHDKLYEQYGGANGDAFAYDKMRRLTNAWMGSTNPASPVGNNYTRKIDYNYDDDGNRTSVVTTPFGVTPTTTNYTTNNLNQYTAVGGTTQVSDSNGNLTDNGTLLFEYDYKNLIVRVKQKSGGATVAEYRYDALGRRVEKDVGGTIERHIRSTVESPGHWENLSHVVATFNGSNVWQQNFVWNDEIDGIQMLEQADVLDYNSNANTTETTRSFYHRNALGSVMEITDLNEATVVSYRYDPYGKVTITRGTTQTIDPLGQHWTFTARFLDEETGLYFYRARYYDSTTGRFIERDPLGVGAGPVLYSYVGDNPSNWIDPTGLSPGSDDTKVKVIATGFYIAVHIPGLFAGAAATDADAETKKAYPNENPSFGRANAFKHCMWMCLTCKLLKKSGQSLKNAQKLAGGVGDHHEKADQATAVAAHALGVFSESEMNYWIQDSEKDRKNNSRGLLCCQSAFSCRICCGYNFEWYDLPPPPPPPAPVPPITKHGRPGLPCDCGSCGYGRESWTKPWKK